MFIDGLRDQICIQLESVSGSIYGSIGCCSRRSLWSCWSYRSCWSKYLSSGCSGTVAVLICGWLAGSQSGPTYMHHSAPQCSQTSRKCLENVGPTSHISYPINPWIQFWINFVWDAGNWEYDFIFLRFFVSLYFWTMQNISVEYFHPPALSRTDYDYNNNISFYRDDFLNVLPPRFMLHRKHIPWLSILDLVA